jgi:hypothetical protein
MPPMPHHRMPPMSPKCNQTIIACPNCLPNVNKVRTQRHLLLLNSNAYRQPTLSLLWHTLALPLPSLPPTPPTLPPLRSLSSLCGLAIDRCCCGARWRSLEIIIVEHGCSRQSMHPWRQRLRIIIAQINQPPLLTQEHISQSFPQGFESVCVR